MDDGQSPLAPAPGPAAQSRPPAWRIARASIELVMDIIDISRGDGHMLDPLLVATVVEGNLALVSQDPELQRRYAEADQPPPDELRRPISIAAVASSLSLPYETVRRRTNGLIRRGAMVSTPKGLIVPAALLTTPAYLEAAIARYERVKRFYFELKALGVTDGLPERDEGVAPLTGPPVRLVNRVLSEFQSRLYEQMLRRLGDLVTGVVALEMGRANAEGLEEAARQIEGPLPDDLRHPISMLALAKRLRLPAETVRRHVRRLEAEGLCRQVDGGFLAEIADLPPQGESTPIQRNLMNLSRMMARLGALGVLAYWEAEAAASGGAGRPSGSI